MANRVALAVDVLARDRASGTLRKVGNEAEKSHRKIASFAGAFAGGALAAGLISFGKSSVAAFGDAEKAQASLAGAFAKFPKLADSNVKSMQKLNAELQRKTRFDDDALASGQSILAQFNLTGKQIEQITPLLADYAARTGQDIPGAATNLGRAFNGNTRALKSLGINYKSTGNAGKDFENVQTLLNAKVGGFAEREGKTAAGQAEILRNQYGEIQEQVGSKLVPVLTDLGGKLLDVIDFTERNSKVIKPLVITVGGLAVAVWGVNKAVVAWQATEKAFLAVKALFTTAVAAEGTAAAVTAGEVTALAAAEGAAATGATVLGGTAAASAVAGISSIGVAAAAALPPLLLLADAYYEVTHPNPKELKNLAAGTPSATIGLPKKSPTITFNGRTYAADGSGQLGKRSNGSVTSISPGNRTIGLRARGGNIEANRAYIVGEDGPELITPRRAGFVHNAARTQNMFGINPKARLDTSQITDRRMAFDPLLLGPLLDPGASRARLGHSPPGLRDYIQYTSLQIDGKRIGAVQTRRTNRDVEKGHLPPGVR
jgi:hypothetical protein